MSHFTAQVPPRHPTRSSISWRRRFGTAKQTEPFGAQPPWGQNPMVLRQNGHRMAGDGLDAQPDREPSGARPPRGQKPMVLSQKGPSRYYRMAGEG